MLVKKKPVFTALSYWTAQGFELPKPVSGEAVKEIIRQEIEYWRRFAKGVEIDPRKKASELIKERPICSAIYEPETIKSCLSCPVAHLTGQQFCAGTRFDDWLKLHRSRGKTLPIKPHGSQRIAEIVYSRAAKRVAASIVVFFEEKVLPNVR